MTSTQITPQLLKAKRKVIDLSADYRLKDARLYPKWYGAVHNDKKNLSTAVYGLPELYREDIKKASLVANPGCYPTAAILGLAPLVIAKAKQIRSIIIDAKSGVTGAGRKAAVELMYSEVNENLKAYRILKHQHTPEIEQELSNLGGKEISVTFVPHLVPLNRGILETIYVQLSQPMSLGKLHDLYNKFYKTEKFVRVLSPETQPEIKYVAGTNYCDIGLSVDEEKNTVVIIAAIDNLMKGAAGQAVQNMNIMCHFSETAGLL